VKIRSKSCGPIKSWARLGLYPSQAPTHLKAVPL